MSWPIMQQTIIISICVRFLKFQAFYEKVNGLFKDPTYAAVRKRVG